MGEENRTSNLPMAKKTGAEKGEQKIRSDTESKGEPGGIGKGALYLRVVMKFLSSSVTSFQHGVLAAMASRYSRTLAGVR
jgi:hypothetical protein